MSDEHLRVGPAYSITANNEAESDDLPEELTVNSSGVLTELDPTPDSGSDESPTANTQDLDEIDVGTGVLTER